MTHLYVWRDAITCVIWPMRMCDVHPSHVWYGAATINRLLKIIDLVCKSSFAEEPYKKDYILQKRPVILRSVLIAATPYDSCICATWSLYTCVAHVSLMTCIWAWLVYVTCILHMCMHYTYHICNMAHSYVRRNAFIWLVFESCLICMSDTCVTCDSHMCDMSSAYLRHDSFICATWLIYMCAMTHMTHSYVQHDSFISATWLIHMTHICDMTSTVPVRNDWFACVTWRIHMCDITHAHVRRAAHVSLMSDVPHMSDMSNVECWNIWVIPNAHIWVISSAEIYESFRMLVHVWFAWVTHVWVMSDTCVTHANQSKNASHQTCVMHSYMQHGSFICAT